MRGRINQISQSNQSVEQGAIRQVTRAHNCRSVLPFAKVLRKSKLSEPPARMRSSYKNAFTTTKNKYYFIKLVGKTIKQILLYNPK